MFNKLCNITLKFVNEISWRNLPFSFSMASLKILSHQHFHDLDAGLITFFFYPWIMVNIRGKSVI